jgi:Zn-dependent protease with chaperone function
LKTIFLLLLFPCGWLTAQQNPFHHFQQDDTIQKQNWLQAVREVKTSWMGKVNPVLKKDYELVYKPHFELIEKTINSKSCITAKEPHAYLQQLLQKIVEANPVLNKDELRVFFTRDWWPNAYSMGDGSIAINAGLVTQLQNEAELVFVLCHELAHYYKAHTLQSVDQYITLTNSEAFQKKLKELSKKEYGVNAEFEKLSRNLIFNSRHHSRTKETEADMQAFAFFKNTGYAATGIVSLLGLLDTIDKATFSPELNVQAIFQFENYPFKKRWIQEESAIFSQLNTPTEDNEATETDSLKTHPDCTLRIAALKDSVAAQPSGKPFLINEIYFQQLKNELLLEMIEHTYEANKLSLNLYYNLRLLQQQKHTSLAAYFIVRDLNKLYEQQVIHQAGLLIDRENKFFTRDYNQLLRLLNRIRLNELAQLTHSFCKRYLYPLKEFKLVEEQITITEKNNNQH